MSLLLLLSCSFDYGTDAVSDESIPDIVMREFEYVRVSDKQLRVRLQGEVAERYEKQQRMIVVQARFVQYGSDQQRPSSSGRAGQADISLDTGDIVLSDGVQLHVDSEGVLVETGELRWYDEASILLSPDDSYVLLKDENGSMLSGRGFGVDTRRRSWEFADSSSGRYVLEEKKEASPDRPDEEGE